MTASKDTFTFTNLPKVSLNEFYSGGHWGKRKKLKDTFRQLISSQTNKKITYPCEVEYEFIFSRRPLDCSNTVAMVKMIEDCLFDDDSVKIVKSLKITSRKAKDDIVYVRVKKY